MKRDRRENRVEQRDMAKLIGVEGHQFLREGRAAARRGDDEYRFADLLFFGGSLSVRLVIAHRRQDYIR